MNSLDSLWELQEIRKQYLALKKQEQRALGNQEVKKLENRVSNYRNKGDLIDSKIRDMEKDLKKRELDLQALESKRGKLQEELYNGNANPKELSNLQQRLEKTELEIAGTEEDLLRLSEELEMLRESIAAIHTEIVNLDNKLAVLRANLEVELQEVRAEISKVKADHMEKLKTIDKKTLDLYNRKFKQYSVTAVAKVLGGLCTGCNVHLPRYIVAQVKQGDGLVGCENCGRILYYAVRSE